MLTTHQGGTGSPSGARAAPELLGRRQRALVLALLVVGPAFGLASFFLPALRAALPFSSVAHVAIAGAVATIGVVLGLLVLQAARRSNDSRVLVIGLTLLGSALIFLIHAVATPRVFVPGTSAVGISAQLSLVVAGVGFGLSGFEIRPSIDRWMTGHARLLLVLVLTCWGALAWSLLAPAAIAGPPAQAGQAAQAQAGGHDHGAAPAAAPAAPAPDTRPLIAIGMAGYLFGAWQHYRLFRASPSWLGIGLVCGIVLFGSALVLQSISAAASAVFWGYHALEVAGIACISAAVLRAYRGGLVDETLLESLFLSQTRARIQANYAHALDELIELLAKGERPGAEQRRTLRDRFGLADTQVEALERAASAVAQERTQRVELERLNDALRQVERDREQLVQMVVHDLKNPLTALVGFLEILQLDSLTEGQRELLESALRSGRNLSGLISDLLDVARLREGQLAIERAPVAVRGLAEASAAEMGAWALQDGKSLTVDCPDDLVVAGDERMLLRVLLNLISNAIKHTPSGTRIALRAAAGGDGWVRIEVADDGRGIAPDQLDRIFERFTRGGSASAGRQQSTGLGLSFCKLAAEAHGGRIEVESTLGAGATFRVLLPAT